MSCAVSRSLSSRGSSSQTISPFSTSDPPARLLRMTMRPWMGLKTPTGPGAVGWAASRSWAKAIAPGYEHRRARYHPQAEYVGRHGFSPLIGRNRTTTTQSNKSASHATVYKRHRLCTLSLTMSGRRAGSWGDEYREICFCRILARYPLTVVGSGGSLKIRNGAWHRLGFDRTQPSLSNSAGRETTSCLDRGSWIRTG